MVSVREVEVGGRYVSMCQTIRVTIWCLDVL